MSKKRARTTGQPKLNTATIQQKLSQLERENSRLKEVVSHLNAALQDSAPRSEFQKSVEQINQIVLAQWRAYKAADRLYGVVIATHDPRLLEKALQDYAPILQTKIDALTTTLDAFDMPWRQDPGDVLQECWQVQRAIEAHDIETLRTLAAQSDPVSPGLKQMAEEIWKQQEQAAQQTRQKHTTEATKERQHRKELAIQELRRLKSERPTYSVPRLRDHYVAKCEGQLEAGPLPPERQMVYDYIKDLSESALHSWRGEINSSHM